jgi:hypothetical protein
VKAEWIASVNGQEYGPYTWDQMLQMMAEGRVLPDSLVRRASDKQWFKASQIPGLLKSAPSRTHDSSVVRTAGGNASGKSAVSSSTQLKRAKPLVATPPPPAPASAAAPRSTLLPGATPPVVVVTPPAAVSAKMPTAQDDEDQPRRSSPAVMIGICVGSAAAMALVGVVIVAVVWSRSASMSARDAGAARANLEVAPTSHESNPALSPADSAPANARPQAKAAEQKKPADSASERQKLLKSIVTWRSLATLRAFGVGNAQLQIARVWLADETGKQVAAAADAKYVCVEVAITNKVASPLKYRGWNTSGSTGAILADDKLNVLPLVPVQTTPALARITSASIPGNSTTTDILVFEAPRAEFESLHLVLPYKVFYNNVRTPHAALELTPDVIGRDLTTPLAAGSSAPAPATLRDQINSLEPARHDDAPKPAASAEAESSPSKPPSLRDMINAEDDRKPRAAGRTLESEKPEPAKPKPENPFEPKRATLSGKKPSGPQPKDDK